jgi:hypothetical protein
LAQRGDRRRAHGRVSRRRGSLEGLRQWVDDILNAGDEWIDERVKQWLDAKHTDWIKQQSASGREPTAKEIARKRAEFEGERRLVAEKRAQIAREYAKLQADASARGRTGRLNGSGDNGAVDKWSDDARVGRRGVATERERRMALRHDQRDPVPLHERAIARWIDTEKAEGASRALPTSPRGAAIVAKFNEIKNSCAEIQADVAEKKQKSIEAGGLYVLGTERHESRRIDNQLRGRSGRQGDPGRSKFYLSLEDDLMRIFGSDRMDGMLQKLGLQEGEAMTHPWINKALEKAQQKVEARNFDSRKYVLEYDDVMNDQRKVIFEHRIDIMGARRRECYRGRCASGGAGAGRGVHPPNAYAEQWNSAKLKEEVGRSGLDLPIDNGPEEASPTRRSPTSAEGDRRASQGEGGRVRRRDDAADREDGPAADAGSPLARAPVTLEHLRQVIHLRGYGQRDPLNEYKSEGFHLFEAC